MVAEHFLWEIKRYAIMIFELLHDSEINKILGYKEPKCQECTDMRIPVASFARTTNAVRANNASIRTPDHV